MKKNRYYHLSYCSVCKNRTFNLQNGIICKLTNEQANFSDYCLDYTLDNEKIKQIKNDISSKIESDFCNNSLISTFGNVGKYKELTPSKTSKYNSKKNTHGLKLGKNKFLAPMFILFAVSFLVMIIKGAIDNEKIANFQNAGLAILILCVPFLWFGVKQLLDNKIYIETSDKLLMLNGYIIAWNDILVVGFSELHTGKGPSSINMVIGTKTRGLIVTNIDNIQISHQEIADIIFLNQNTNT
jgi:hypothetical protein